MFFSTAVMTNFYLIWPALIAQTERMFINVKTVDTNGASVCESQGGLPCDSSTHRMFVGLALFVLLVVIPGFPLSIFAALWRKRRQLDSKAVRDRFFFFYGGYRKSKWYWEFIVMARKFTLTTVFVVYAQTPILQTYCGAWVLILSFAIDVTSSPFVNKTEGLAETLSLAAVSIVVIIAQGIVGLRSQQFLDLGGKHADTTDIDLMGILMFVGALHLMVTSSFMYLFAKELWEDARPTIRKLHASVRNAVTKACSGQGAKARTASEAAASRHQGPGHLTVSNEMHNHLQDIFNSAVPVSLGTAQHGDGAGAPSQTSKDVRQLPKVNTLMRMPKAGSNRDVRL